MATENNRDPPRRVCFEKTLGLATDPEAARYNGQHFMAQEFVRQRGLWPEGETTLAMNPNGSPTAILDWRERRRR